MTKNRWLKPFFISFFLISTTVCVLLVVPCVHSVSPPHRFKGFARDSGLNLIENGTVITLILINVNGSMESNTTTVLNVPDTNKNYDINLLDFNDDNQRRPIYFYIGNENTTQHVHFYPGGLNADNTTYYNLTIIDIPQITDNSPDSGHTGDSFTFNVTAIDYVDSPAELRINVSWLHGTHSGNKTLTNTGGNYFAGSITLDNNSVANMTYTIWVNDTSGNHNHSTLQTVTVTDDENPISQVSGISGYWKKASDNPLTITATASDNIGLKNATLYYRFNNNGNTSWGSWAIYGVNTTPWKNSGHPTWSFTFSSTGHYQFYSIAKDNATNAEVAPGSADARCGYDFTAPTTTVSTISVYWRNTNTLITATVSSNNMSGIDTITLYCRNSTDNSTWSNPWVFGTADTDPWVSAQWTFTFPNGTGYYRFYSRGIDNATNTETLPGVDSPDAICGYDITAPVLSSISAGSITASSATITWTTNEAANTTVEYGTTTSYGSTSSNATGFVTSHSRALGSLSAGTTYHYRVKSYDRAGNAVTSSDNTFITGSGGDGSYTPGGSEADHNTAPIADAGGPYVDFVNTTITFNGVLSRDSDGSVVGYRWDWTNDGAWDTDWLTSSTTTHVYTLAGNFTVRLQVKDNGSATDDDTASVTIKALPIIYASQEALDFLNNSFGLKFTTAFYGTDTNGDDVVDTFTDPNHLLTLVRFANIDGSASFLLSIGNDDIPEFFWDTTTNTTTLIHHSVGAVIDIVDNADTKTKTMTVSVEKANWTYIEVIDLYPDNPDLIVKTADGRTISSEMIWRKDGKIFILDDPVTEYQIIYGYAQGPLFDVTVVLIPNSILVGADISALITLSNVGEPGLVNGTVTYTLYSGGEIVWSSEESVSVLSQKTYTKTISTDGLSSGSYTYKIIYSYAGNQTASAEGIFTVEAAQKPFWENILLWAVIIIVIIIVVIIAVLFKLGYLYFDNKEK